MEKIINIEFKKVAVEKNCYFAAEQFVAKHKKEIESLPEGFTVLSTVQTVDDVENGWTASHICGVRCVFERRGLNIRLSDIKLAQAKFK